MYSHMHHQTTENKHDDHDHHSGHEGHEGHEEPKKQCYQTVIAPILLGLHAQCTCCM